MKSTEETVKPTEVRGKIGSMSEPTITEFLEARITEDEAAARACVVPEDGGCDLNWRMEGTTVYPLYQQTDGSANEGNYIPAAHAAHIISHNPARVLAECAAKRAIIAAHPVVDDVYEVSTRVKYGYACSTCFSYGDIVEDHGYCDTLRALAAVYANHEDYRPEWKL